MECFVQLLLENRTEVLELPDLGAFESFNIGSGTRGELLFVLIPVKLELFEVVLLLPKELAHLDVIGIEES